jgi:transcription initiation factor IIE alpha subunit
MSAFKNTKENAKRRKITDAQRTAAKKERILEGFQCPQKRCMHILKLSDYKAAGMDHICGRCGTNIEEFTPLMTDLRRITPKDILLHDL